jgi:hypothetical protein
LNTHFSKEAKWPIIHEETFNILSHKGKANENATEIPFHRSQNGYHYGNKQQKSWPWCRKRKSVWSLLKKLNIGWRYGSSDRMLPSKCKALSSNSCTANPLSPKG